MSVGTWIGRRRYRDEIPALFGYTEPMTNTKQAYEAPSIKVAGTLHELTLTSNKFATHTPDGILFHPPTGSPIPLTS